jgi:hypothetical protein
MNLRRIVIFVSMATCLATLALVLTRQRQIADLRTKQRDLVSQAPPTLSMAEPRPSYTPSLELLRLRSKVTQLENRKREFANSRAENERLHVQVAGRATNTIAALPLPPDYILSSKARFVGYNKPEDTIQSWLWASHNRDLTNLLQTLTPEEAENYRRYLQRFGGPAEKYFGYWLDLPGLRLGDRQPQPDGSVELTVEIAPGAPESHRIWARLVDGQWKLEFSR